MFFFYLTIFGCTSTFHLYLTRTFYVFMLVFIYVLCVLVVYKNVGISAVCL